MLGIKYKYKLFMFSLGIFVYCYFCDVRENRKQINEKFQDKHTQVKSHKVFFFFKKIIWQKWLADLKYPFYTESYL